MLYTPTASTNTPRPLHTLHAHTHRGNSCGVGAQIKTNADESSFCKPYQCSATGAVLLQLQWRLLGLVTSCVKLSHGRISLCHIFIVYIQRVDCWRKEKMSTRWEKDGFFKTCSLNSQGVSLRKLWWKLWPFLSYLTWCARWKSLFVF